MNTPETVRPRSLLSLLGLERPDRPDEGTRKGSESGHLLHPDSVGGQGVATPVTERARLRELHAYGILDTVPEQAYDDLTTLAASICRAPIALVSFVDSRRLWFKARVGLDVASIARSVGFCDHAISSPESVFEVTDAAADARFEHSPLVPGVRFYAGASLVSPKGHAVGTICVLDSQPRGLVESEREGLASLARQVVAQLELRRTMANLAEEASTDPLTSALNRRAFDRRLRLEWQAHASVMHPLSLLLFDIDHFKRLNDTHGHEAGDTALVEVVRRARSVLRDGDMLCRLGGEEFGVILPDTDNHAAASVAENIRQAVSGSPSPAQPVTVSVGVATVAPLPSADPYGALALADAAMYRAKRDGRDCVRA